MFVNNSKAMKKPAMNAAKGRADSLRLKQAWKMMRGGKPPTTSAPSAPHAQAFHATKNSLGAHHF